MIQIDTWGKTVEEERLEREREARKNEYQTSKLLHMARA